MGTRVAKGVSGRPGTRFGRIVLIAESAFWHKTTGGASLFGSAAARNYVDFSQAKMSIGEPS
jgi:hypothetical protein